MKRLLIVNPNADVRVTAWLLEEARRVAPPYISIEAINADSGLAAIETPDHIRIAAAAVVDAIRSAGPEATLIGAFGDPGLAETRALNLPAFGLGECALRAAAASGRFAIVTLGAAMRQPIERRIASLGLSDRLVAIRILPIRIADYAADRDASRTDLAREAIACADLGAETVLLGGAPFAGEARRVRLTRARMIDGVESAVQAAVRG